MSRFINFERYLSGLGGNRLRVGKCPHSTVRLRKAFFLLRWIGLPLAAVPQKLFARPDTLELRKTFDTKQVQSRKNVEPIKKPIEKGQRLDPMVVCFSVKASTGGRQDIHAHDIE